MAKKKVPTAISEYMSSLGKLGGKKGGERSLVTMTDEERSERARKAVAARKKNPVKNTSAAKTLTSKRKETED